MKINFKKIHCLSFGNMFFVVSILFCNSLISQKITLQECYDKARNNYPLLKQLDVINNSELLNIENISKGNYPQINMMGQASFQSEVIELPIKIPGVEIESPARDQYKLYLDVNQNLYDGGLNKAQKQVRSLSSDVERSQVEVELYKIKEKVLSLFFGIIQADEQLNIINLTQKDIELAIKKAQASVDNGVALKSSVNVLKAENLKNDQRKTDLIFARKSFLRMLSILTGIELDNYSFMRPEEAMGITAITRPELQLLNKQSALNIFQNEMVDIKNRPRLSAFFQGGVGRPAFNFLSNDFDPYFIGGLRFQMPLSGFYTKKKEKEIIQLNSTSISIQQDAFLFNLSQQISQQSSETDRYTELLIQDEEIIKLRSDIKKTSLAQLENGVINSSDYLRELNAEEAARQNKALHEIQRIKSIYTQFLISGN